MTCIEYLRKDIEKQETKIQRIQSILNAIEGNTNEEIDRNVNKYHDKHGRNKKIEDY